MKPERILIRTSVFVIYAGKVHRVVGCYSKGVDICHFCLEGDTYSTYFDPFSSSMEPYLTVSEDCVKFIEGDPEQLELLYG